MDRVTASVPPPTRRGVLLAGSLCAASGVLCGLAWGLGAAWQTVALLALLTLSSGWTAWLQHVRRRKARQRDTRYADLLTAAQLLGRYVPAQLAEQILAGDYPADTPPRRRRLTIVFSDIEGYTAACEALDAASIEAVLNRYLTEMITLADSYGGTVNQIVGDGIMFLFGAPKVTNDRDHALRAVHMAQAMQQRMHALAGLWRDCGWDRPLRIRIGLNTGEASVGDFGSAQRKLYSGIGLQTNLAQRIEAACAPGGILISAATWELVRDAVPCVAQGTINAKGARLPLLVYAVSVPAEPDGAR